MAPKENTLHKLVLELSLASLSTSVLSNVSKSPESLHSNLHVSNYSIPMYTGGNLYLNMLIQFTAVLCSCLSLSLFTLICRSCLLNFLLFFIFRGILYNGSLCRPSEASTRYCAILGGYPPQDWQSLLCAGEELDSNPLICSIAMEPPLLLKISVHFGLDSKWLPMNQ